MAVTVTMGTAGETAVATKVVTDDDGEGHRRLDRERELLATHPHPGLVALVDHGPAHLTTAFAGQPLRQLAAVNVTVAASIVGTVAHTVADLHDREIAHGAIDHDHVLVGADGTPRLCSLHRITVATPSDRADDVAALGELLRALIGSHTTQEVIPTRRIRRARAHTGNAERGALLTLADHASADVAGHRPPARRLATLIGETVPDATVRRLSEINEDPESSSSVREVSAASGRPRPSRSRRGIALTLAVAATMVATVARWPDATPAGSPDASMPHRSPVSRDSAVVRPPAPSTSPTTVEPAGQTVPGECARRVGVDLTGDGCPEETVVVGNTVRIGDVRFEVGDSDDLVAVGDWNCDGHATPAVLQVPSGSIYAFDTWPSVDSTADPIARLSGATAILADLDSIGCASLVVIGPGGRRHVVPVPA